MLEATLLEKVRWVGCLVDRFIWLQTGQFSKVDVSRWLSQFICLMVGFAEWFQCLPFGDFSVDVVWFGGLCVRVLVRWIFNTSSVNDANV